MGAIPDEAGPGELCGGAAFDVPAHTPVGGSARRHPSNREFGGAPSAADMARVVECGPAATAKDHHADRTDRRR